MSPSSNDHNLFYRELARLLPDGASVLDLACGDGDFLQEALRGGASKAVGVEISESGVLACVRAGLSVYHGDITEGLSSYPDRSFDCVSLIRTLELLLEPEPVLDEMLRVGREALITFTNFGHIRHGLKYLFTGTVPGTLVTTSHEGKNARAKDLQLGGPPCRLTLPLFKAYCRQKGIEVRKVVALPCTWRARLSRGLFARELAVLVAQANR